ncbi:hypothetical protein BGV68_11205 [Burkholderia ubonensis]|nr:hypothetical protein BGV68_11205 [Burkholderia ubonensis]
MKSKRTSDGRKLDHATLQAMRQQTVKAIHKGQDVASVAAAYGVNERSVYHWLADFANGGQNALLAKSNPGRPPKVGTEEMQWLAQAVRDHSPLQFKFEFGLWTLSLIAALIERQFDKKLALSGVSRIMSALRSRLVPACVRRMRCVTTIRLRSGNGCNGLGRQRQLAGSRQLSLPWKEIRKASWASTCHPA